MLTAVLALAGANAQPVGPPPAPSARGFASVLAGADAWTGGGGGGLLLRAAGAGAIGRSGRWSAASSDELLVGPAGTTVLDVQQVDLVARRGSLTGGVEAAGSLGLTWATLALPMSARLTSNHSPLQVTLAGAPLVWVGGELAPGGRAAVSASTASERVRWYATGGGRALGGALPPGDVYATSEVGLGSSVRSWVGATVIWAPPSEATPTSGLWVPGSTIGRVALALEVDLGTDLVARIDALPEAAWGAAPYTRMAAFAGLQLPLGRRPQPEPILLHGARSERPVQFGLRAGGADRVEVAGGFTDWAPRAMSTEDGSLWTLELSVPVGSWPFVYMVDGAVVTPPRAHAWEPDGFGGTNGILVVTEDATPLPTLYPEAPGPQR